MTPANEIPEATLTEILAPYVRRVELPDALADVSIHVDRAVDRELDTVVDDTLEPIETALRHVHHEAETEYANAVLDRSPVLAKVHQVYAEKLAGVLRLLDDQDGDG